MLFDFIIIVFFGICIVVLNSIMIMVWSDCMLGYHLSTTNLSEMQTGDANVSENFISSYQIRRTKVKRTSRNPCMIRLNQHNARSIQLKPMNPSTFSYHLGASITNWLASTYQCRYLFQFSHTHTYAIFSRWNSFSRTFRNKNRTKFSHVRAVAEQWFTFTLWFNACNCALHSHMTLKPNQLI